MEALVEWDREAALDICFNVAKLLEEKYFSDACDALLAEDYAEFHRVCARAKIPSEGNLHERLYAMLRSGLSAESYMVWP